MLIFLTGFMCSGKTTDGKAAAKLLEVPFLDLDEELEKRSGISIWDYTDLYGIAEFRKAESEILLQTWQFLQKQLLPSHLSARKPEAVIATGGGSVLIPENRVFLTQPDHSVVWLDLPFPILLERIRTNKRPLLQGMKDEDIRTVWSERLPYYQQTCTNKISSLPFSSAIVNLFSIHEK